MTFGHGAGFTAVLTVCKALARSEAWHDVHDDASASLELLIDTDAIAVPVVWAWPAERRAARLGVQRGMTGQERWGRALPRRFSTTSW